MIYDHTDIFRRCFQSAMTRRNIIENGLKGKCKFIHDTMTFK